MATSAQTLSLIIDELVKNSPQDRAAALALLGAKGYLPKKLMEAPKQEKKVSRFASKAAEDFADAKGLEIPEDFKGSAANDKISVKDLKLLAEGATKTKVNASPSAQQYARDNDIDLNEVKGSGNEGKILLRDVKDFKPAEPAEPTKPTKPTKTTKEKKVKVSSAAAKIMKKYELDEEDLLNLDVKGTGPDGSVVAKDLKELVDNIEENKEDESSGEESSGEESSDDA